MKYFLVIVLVTLGVAAAHPWFNTTGLQYKRLSKIPIKFWQGSSVGGRIINGSEVVPHSRPYEAYIVFQSNSYGSMCGGALISNNYVLTAGHCVNGAISANVLIGAHDLLEEESTWAAYTAESFILHEKYDEDQILYDIGLIKLTESVTLTSAIQTIPLPAKSDATKSYEGETVTIIGWGLTDPDADDTTDVLMEVDVKVISFESCKTYYDNVQDYQICTSGDQNKGACDGDSGSPLIYNNVAIGITSYGSNGCLSGYPTAFTNTGYFLDWIQENSDVIVA